MSENPDRRGDRRRRLLLLVASLVVAFAVLGGYRAHWRAQHASSFCAGSCHAPAQNEGTTAELDPHRKSHREVACQSCHAISATAGLRLALSTAGAKDVVAHGRVGPESCTSCHAGERALFAATQGHRQHADAGAKGVDCLSCHGKTTHGSDPPEKACLSCHKDERLHRPTTPADAETCLSCHGFAATPAKAKPPTPTACGRCHAAGATPTEKPINEHVLHGGVACELCHNAHGKKAKPPDGQPICVRCHKFEQFQPLHASTIGDATRDASASDVVKAHTDCEGCHKPHAPRKTATTRCVDCHESRARGVPLARGTNRVENAPAKIAGEGKTTALRHDGCPSCHLPHTWRAERSGCKQCHREQAKLVLDRSPAAHEQCTGCHEVHGPPPTGKVCLNCHAATKASHVALAPERHKDCTACHDPHAPKPEDTRNACIKCHSDQVSQVARQGPEGHKGCFGCHKPHENPLPPPDICGKCHGDRASVVAAASPPKHRVCTSCHERHRFSIRDPVTACSKCHGEMFQAAAAIVATTHERAPHGGPCKSCHTFHGSPGVAKATCLSCHEKVAAGFDPPNAKHAACRSCHEPHQPVSTARAACASCHEAKAAIAAKWPPASAHAQECTKCHEQHAAKRKKTCDACHAAEVASALGGKHQCTQCHPPHSAPPGVGAAWWSRCSSCHAAKVESVKARGPKHSDCKNCHQPHRFAVPSCTSCHSDMPEKGLHSVAAHAANCKACHDPHVAAVPTPAQCRACHTNAHEPNASSCQSCHMFR